MNSAKWKLLKGLLNKIIRETTWKKVCHSPCSLQKEVYDTTTSEIKNLIDDQMVCKPALDCSLELDSRTKVIKPLLHNHQCSSSYTKMAFYFNFCVYSLFALSPHGPWNIFYVWNSPYNSFCTVIFGRLVYPQPHQRSMNKWLILRNLNHREGTLRPPPAVCHLSPDFLCWSLTQRSLMELRNIIIFGNFHTRGVQDCFNSHLHPLPKKVWPILPTLKGILTNSACSHREFDQSCPQPQNI